MGVVSRCVIRVVVFLRVCGRTAVRPYCPSRVALDAQQCVLTSLLVAALALPRVCGRTAVRPYLPSLIGVTPCPS